MPAGTRGTAVLSRTSRSRGHSALFSLENPPSAKKGSTKSHPSSLTASGRSTRQASSTLRAASDSKSFSGKRGGGQTTRALRSRRGSANPESSSDDGATSSTSQQPQDDKPPSPRQTRSRGNVPNGLPIPRRGTPARSAAGNGSTRKMPSRKVASSSESSAADSEQSSSSSSSSSKPRVRSLRSRGGAAAAPTSAPPVKKEAKIEPAVDKDSSTTTATPVKRRRRGRGILGQLNLTGSPPSSGLSSPVWSDEIKTRSTRPRPLDIEKKLPVILPENRDYEEAVAAVEVDLHFQGDQLEGTLIEVSERNSTNNANVPVPTPDLAKAASEIITPSIRNIAPIRPPNGVAFAQQQSYYRTPEETQDYLDSRPSEYDLDSEDEAWLTKLNDVDSTLLSQDQFERWMDRLEHASYEAQQRRRDVWGCPRQQDVFAEIIRKYREDESPEKKKSPPGLQLLKQEGERITAELSARNKPDPEYIAQHAPTDCMPADDLNALMTLPSRPSSGDGVNNAGKDDVDIVCCVCYDGDSEANNQILLCDGCNIAVHQKCYGIPKIPNGDWFCSRCSSKTPTDVACVLCAQTDGAMKRSTCDRWVHVSCALWLPEPTFLDRRTMEPVDRIRKIPNKHWNHQCSVCSLKKGVTMQCASKGCPLRFHVTCGRKRGLAMKLCAYKGPNGDEVLTCAYCQHHTNAVLDAHTPDVTEFNVKYELDTLKDAANWHYPRWRVTPEDAQEVLHDASMPLMQAMYRYWIYKRLTAEKGHPLLQRLQVDEYGLRYSPGENEEKHRWRGRLRHERERNMQTSYDMLTQLREDLERTRVLIDLVKKRERYKKALCNHTRALFEARTRFSIKYPKEKLPTIRPNQTLEEIHEILGLAAPVQRNANIPNPNARFLSGKDSGDEEDSGSSTNPAAKGSKTNNASGSGTGNNKRSDPAPASASKRVKKDTSVKKDTTANTASNTNTRANAMQVDEEDDDVVINVVDDESSEEVRLTRKARSRSNSTTAHHHSNNRTGGAAGGTSTVADEDTTVVVKSTRGIGRPRRLSVASVEGTGDNSSSTAEAPAKRGGNASVSTPSRAAKQAASLPSPVTVNIPPLAGGVTAGLRVPDPRPLPSVTTGTKRKGAPSTTSHDSKRARGNGVLRGGSASAGAGSGTSKGRRGAGASGAGYGASKAGGRHTRSRDAATRVNANRKGDNCCVQ